MGERKQALDRREPPVTRSRLQSLSFKTISPRLKVAEGDGVERFTYELAEKREVFRVGPLGVGTAAMQPEADQLLIGFRLPRSKGRKGAGGCEDDLIGHSHSNAR